MTTENEADDQYAASSRERLIAKLIACKLLAAGSAFIAIMYFWGDASWNRAIFGSLIGAIVASAAALFFAIHSCRGAISLFRIKRANQKEELTPITLGLENEQEDRGVAKREID